MSRGEILRTGRDQIKVGSFAPAELSLNDSEVVKVHYLFISDFTSMPVLTTSEGGGSSWVQVILRLE